MAQRDYSFNLIGYNFPFLSNLQPQTTLVTAAGNVPTALNRPSVLYCENIMPSARGIESVSYRDLVPVPNQALLPEDEFVDVRIVYDTDRQRRYIAFTKLGRAYVLNTLRKWFGIANSNAITGYPTIAFSPDRITTGTVNGVTYLFFDKTVCFTYNISTTNFAVQTLTGINIPDTLGVVASSGYLIAYTNKAVAWSSTVDPTDFTPSLTTGAGGASIADIGGEIKFCTPNSNGFFIYTEANVISALYTGNIRFPFKFTEVSNSKGAISLDTVAYEANSGEQFAYAQPNGIQSVTSKDSKIIFAPLSDFLRSGVIEEFDTATNTFSYTTLPSLEALKVKIKFIAARYLVVSYGINTFDYAIVYDVNLERWGKLKITHTDVVEFIFRQTTTNPDNIPINTPIMFLKANGEMAYLDVSERPKDSEAILILGKVQYSDSRYSTLLHAEINNVKGNLPISLDIIPSLDGTNFLPSVSGNLISGANAIKRYGLRTTALNHSLIIKGVFHLVSTKIQYALKGRVQ